MTQEESGLFEIRLTEDGKKFIRKLVAISYGIQVLVIFQSAVSFYWSIRIFTMQNDYERFYNTAYDKIFPYLSIVLAVLNLMYNMYFVRFPRQLQRSIEAKDEFGANQAFKILFRGALVFLSWLLINSASIIWSVMLRQF